MKIYFELLTIFAVLWTSYSEPGELADIRARYGMLETNLIEIVQSGDPGFSDAMYALGYLRAGKDLLMDRISATEYHVSYFDEDGFRVSFGRERRMPGVVYPALISLEYMKPDLDEYLSRIMAETNNSLSVDLWALSAYSVHGTNFLDTISQLQTTGTDRWEYVFAFLNREIKPSHPKLEFGNPFYLVRTSVKYSYEEMQTNLLGLAISACMEQNPTNLLDIVSTYRFIHAPIPEAIFTNDFFQATIGEE